MTAADQPAGIPPELITRLLEAAADAPIALVGGAVRDLLLHRVHLDPWRGVPDFDLVVESPPPGAGRQLAAPDPAQPAALDLARRLRDRLGPAVVITYREHAAYGTAELQLRQPQGAVFLDLASARREDYPVPGENPQVRFGVLGDDLSRRDFTINAMALPLGPDPSGGDLAAALIDPHGGQADLERRQLRFLHDGSLRDDPTRIVRGARYAARLGFSLAPESQAQLRATLEEWPWGWRIGDHPDRVPAALGTRLRMELELLFDREAWQPALGALQAWGALPLLDPALQQDPQLFRRLRWARRFGLPLLVAFLAGAGDPLALAQRLQLAQKDQQILAGLLSLRQQLPSLPPRSPSQWCALLEAPGRSPEAVALALACGLGPRRPLLRWLLRWRRLRAVESAAELIAQGLVAGPALGQRLRELRNQRLDQERR
ncbi:CCA tRNA nucleotidyltransferase [Synechococcus sp. CS-1325]|uniref:CCA tRNA nucleotidyltransferase n=1 Tax=unclassified Synechococcus TaxID=2626047 RepID=UPI0021A6A4AC|nr:MULTISPECIES: CCA tRNA nucleotidyltransferase [unclassified Synechococcus]MCT0198477.1 CCA tRNA nucleotidyltransferase [Synechococcus sp. CS-1325]MCT0213597.1 CCA tRNA nucleotidyltransferase [Synechococcus sp. CS-1326]MCT0232188.1 CCA tRNA nucleotidyltransferase [Synechococcus sp. CS-1327]